MNETTNGFANRCLPLRIASGHGWEVINPFRFGAIWTGGDNQDAVLIQSDRDVSHWVKSHFGFGTITFSMHFLLVTQGVHTMVTGPCNEVRDAIQPLAGIIETDWAHMTFTMNWKFTRPNEPVIFDEGEPICQFFPLPCMVESKGAQIRIDEDALEYGELKDHPELDAKYRAWSKKRDALHAGIRNGTINPNTWHGDYQNAARRKRTRFE